MTRHTCLTRIGTCIPATAAIVKRKMRPLQKAEGSGGSFPFPANVSLQYGPAASVVAAQRLLLSSSPAAGLFLVVPGSDPARHAVIPLPPSRPMSSRTTKTTRNMKNNTRAMSAEADAIPPKPNTAAIIATNRNINAHANRPMIASFHLSRQLSQRGWHTASTDGMSDSRSPQAGSIPGPQPCDIRLEEQATGYVTAIDDPLCQPHLLSFRCIDDCLA